MAANKIKVIGRKLSIERPNIKELDCLSWAIVNSYNLRKEKLHHRCKVKLASWVKCNLTA